MTPSSPDPSQSSSLARRLEAVRARIAAAARSAGRPGPVVLTAVTKTQPPEAVAAILAAGQRVFGENRVQEARARWDGVRATTDGLELR
ncbi:MAG: YggS family pyridoxal phosphate-dependent enzyme, partial [Brevundimonas sp.]